jgi:undecaprenyl-diphosphatase
MGELEAAWLAAVQGLTEFLPVSSSGHLVVLQGIMHVPRQGIAFEVVVHLGTLVAVLAVYGRHIVSLLAGALRRDRSSLRMVGLLALGSVPAGAAGVLLGGPVRSLFDSPLTAAAMLLVTGSLLFATRWAGPATRRPGVVSALLVGVAQAMALLPGISRSGSTIAAGLFRGLDREEAARFSFLLSVPAIAGAGLLELRGMDGAEVGLHLPVGFVVAAVTGYSALRLLLRFVRRGRLHLFSWYCWAAGIAGILTLILEGQP